MKTGDLVTLKVPCLGNPPGTRGVCYETYYLGEPGGASFIFPNGEYDGFNEREQAAFLTAAGHCPDCSGYRFTNVLRLSSDFARGFFTVAFHP